MDKELRTLVEENNRLLKRNLELSRNNEKKINKIHAYIRRSFIGKIIYWGIIIALTLGAYYVVKPFVDTSVEKYNLISQSLSNANNYAEHPEKIIGETFNPSASILNIIQSDFVSSLFSSSQELGAKE